MGTAIKAAQQGSLLITILSCISLVFFAKLQTFWGWSLFLLVTQCPTHSKYQNQFPNINKYLESYLKQNLKYFITDCPSTFHWNLWYFNCCVKCPLSPTFPQYIKTYEAEEESTSFCRNCCHWNFAEMINCPQRDLADKVCHRFPVLAPFGLSSSVVLGWMSSHVRFNSLWKTGAVHELFLRQQERFTGRKLMKLERTDGSIPVSLGMVL